MLNAHKVLHNSSLNAVTTNITKQISDNQIFSNIGKMKDYVLIMLFSDAQQVQFQLSEAVFFGNGPPLGG